MHSLIYVVIAIAATWIYAKVISKSERFSIITGKGYRPRVTELGRGRWLALGLVLLFSRLYHPAVFGALLCLLPPFPAVAFGGCVSHDDG